MNYIAVTLLIISTMVLWVLTFEAVLLMKRLRDWPWKKADIHWKRDWAVVLFLIMLSFRGIVNMYDIADGHRVKEGVLLSLFYFMFIVNGLYVVNYLHKERTK